MILLTVFGLWYLYCTVMGLIYCKNYRFIIGCYTAITTCVGINLISSNEPIGETQFYMLSLWLIVIVPVMLKQLDRRKRDIPYKGTDRRNVKDAFDGWMVAHEENERKQKLQEVDDTTSD